MSNYIRCKNCDNKVQYTDGQVRRSRGGYSVYNLDGSFAGVREDYYIYCPKCDSRIIVDHGFTEYQ